MKKRQWHDCGTIVLGTDVVVSDPCYGPDVWCKKALENMLPGRYVCRVQTSDEGDWGTYVSEIRIAREGCLSKRASDVEFFRNIGVDSGQCGFYDTEYFAERGGRSDEAWYSEVCGATLSDIAAVIGQLPTV